MDRGLFNGQRSNDQRAATPNRTEATAHRATGEPQSSVEHHRPSASVRHEAPKQSWLKRLAVPLAAALIVAAVGLAGWLAVSKMGGNGAVAIDSSKYQAVFFTNGQVYFGKLTNVNDNYLKLTDIFYLQTSSSDSSESENPQKTDTTTSEVKLIKLGDEVHGPEDEMVISRDQLLFYENLKSEGKVAKTIADSKK